MRKLVPEKCECGYTLFSLWDTEYFMDMNGLIVHKWPMSGSRFGELLPDGNLVDCSLGKLAEYRPNGTIEWQWAGDESLASAIHHNFCREDEIYLLATRETPVREDVCEGYAMQ